MAQKWLFEKVGVCSCIKKKKKKKKKNEIFSSQDIEKSPVPLFFSETPGIRTKQSVSSCQSGNLHTLNIDETSSSYLTLFRTHQRIDSVRQKFCFQQ